MLCHAMTAATDSIMKSEMKTLEAIWIGSVYNIIFINKIKPAFVHVGNLKILDPHLFFTTETLICNPHIFCEPTFYQTGFSNLYRGMRQLY